MASSTPPPESPPIFAASNDTERNLPNSISTSSNTHMRPDETQFEDARHPRHGRHASVDAAFDTGFHPAVSSPDEVENSDNLSLREWRGIREVDAGSIVGPVISRTQTAALYAAAASPAHSPPSSVSGDSDDEAQDAAAAALSPAPSIAPTPIPNKHSFKPKTRIPAFDLPSLKLPSLPNVSFPSFAAGNTTFSNILEKGRRARTYTLQFHKHNSQNIKPVQSTTPGTIPSLRRASSDGSLSRRLTRISSAASSLGDDSQFEHVRAMRNSRLRAIKDNIRAGLPTIPQLPYIQQQWSNLNLNPFTEAGPQETGVPRESHALEALDTLTGDVVVLGGYRGSVLRQRADGKRVWVPLKVSLNLRQVNLEVPLEEEADEEMDSKIYADGMLKHIGPVDISRRLLRRLTTNSTKHNRRVFDYGYDWRLSPSLLVTRLLTFLSSLPCNTTTPPRGATVIAHSLGGLIVRSAINLRPDLFSGVIFAGTPSHCVNILGPLRNGDSVLFNSKVFTAQVMFTIRTSFVFLPESGRLFVDKNTGEEILLDFFDPEVWKENALSPCVSAAPTPSHVVKDRGIQPSLHSAAQYQPITLPPSAAEEYLTRILASTRLFKKSLQFKPELEKAYPPMAVIYAKTTPTVRGARVDGKEGIRGEGVYDDLVFGAGDGVCLAKAAMLPEGYRCVKGGRVEVDRGHLSLLGDLEGVGRAVEAVRRARGW